MCKNTNVVVGFSIVLLAVTLLVGCGGSSGSGDGDGSTRSVPSGGSVNIPSNTTK
jgi:hypothetical protein